MPPATAVYFDAALVAKFYLNEPGRDVVRRVARKAGTVVTSGVALAEVPAAFHRKLRERGIAPDVFEALQGQFEHDVANGLWSLAGPSEALLQDVRALFRRLDASVFLRSLDAVHIVTAKAERFERIYTNDGHMLKACPRLGLEGVNPLQTISRRG